MWVAASLFISRPWLPWGAPVLCPVAFLPCGASWSAVASVAQALVVPAPAVAEAFRVPDDNAAAEGKHPSVAPSSQLEKYKSVHGPYRSASHSAGCLVFLVGGTDLAANGVPFRIAEFGECRKVPGAAQMSGAIDGDRLAGEIVATIRHQEHG